MEGYIPLRERQLLPWAKADGSELPDWWEVTKAGWAGKWLGRGTGVVGGDLGAGAEDEADRGEGSSGNSGGTSGNVEDAARMGDEEKTIPLLGSGEDDSPDFNFVSAYPLLSLPQTKPPGNRS